MRIALVIFCLVSLMTLNTHAHLIDRPDGHAPIGVMGDHTHHKGRWMVSFRSMYMEMDGLQQGLSEVSRDELFSSTSYMMAPRKMEMWMHMLGAMYAFTDHFTLMAMLPYLSSDMTMDRKMQGDMTSMTTSGIGDASLTALYSIMETKSQRMLVSLGVFLPTGSIQQEQNGGRMGYPMQLGSGSMATQHTYLYSYYWSYFSAGTQLGLKYFLDKNGENYKRGSEYFVNLWGAYNWCDSLSSSLRLKHQIIDPISGSDENINAMMSPANQAAHQHGKTTTAYLGINWLGQSFAKGHRLALEVGLPVYQDLNGPQMKQSFSATLGWQKAF